MKSHSSRLASLEKQSQAQPVIDPEAMRAGIIAKLDAVLSGAPLGDPQPMTPARAEILQRLENIANANH